MAMRLIFTAILASMVASSYANAGIPQAKDTLVEIDGNGPKKEQAAHTQIKFDGKGKKDAKDTLVEIDGNGENKIQAAHIQAKIDGKGGKKEQIVVIDGDGSLDRYSEGPPGAKKDAPRKYIMRTAKAMEKDSKKPHVDVVSPVALDELEAQEDEFDGDVALDELEAMTIEAALLRKHFTPPAAVDCTWGAWEKDGPCSKSCGGGSQSWQREIKTKAAHGGKSCSFVQKDEISHKNRPTKSSHQDDSDEDMALDELEATTLAASMQRKKFSKNEVCQNDPCPTTTTTPAPTTTPAGAMRNGGLSFFLIFGLWAVVPQ